MNATSRRASQSEIIVGEYGQLACNGFGFGGSDFFFSRGK